MAQTTQARVRAAWITICGFACCQGFIYAMLYLSPLRQVDHPALASAHGGLVGVLACVVVSFAAIFALGPQWRSRLFEPRVLAALSVLPVLATLLVCFFGIQVWTAALYCVCAGVPAGILLCAWGRVLGSEAIERSVPEVFIGSALGAAVGFALDSVNVEGLTLLLCVLPLASSLALRSVRARDAAEQREEDVPSRAALEPKAAMSEAACELSSRIIAGTVMFGLAAGLMEAFGSSVEGDGSAPALMLVVFVLYCLAALQLFGGNPLINMRSVLPQRAHDDRGGQGGPLDGAYRLAMFLLMAGFLLMPVLARMGLPGETVVLSGYLGLATVMMSLFLIMGRISNLDAALSFARGFIALFSGEVAGLLLGSGLVALEFADMAVVVAAVAGIAALYGYLFLFTERDLRALSIVVEQADAFDRACERIAREAGLSKRESEILPMALRGRTSERIASEFFITKNTVDTHMRRIYAKCGVRSRQELIDLGERAERELKDGRA